MKSCHKARAGAVPDAWGGVLDHGRDIASHDSGTPPGPPLPGAGDHRSPRRRERARRRRAACRQRRGRARLRAVVLAGAGGRRGGLRCGGGGARGPIHRSPGAGPDDRHGSGPGALPGVDGVRHSRTAAAGAAGPVGGQLDVGAGAVPLGHRAAAAAPGRDAALAAVASRPGPELGGAGAAHRGVGRDPLRGRDPTADRGARPAQPRGPGVGRSAGRAGGVGDRHAGRCRVGARLAGQPLAEVVRRRATTAEVASRGCGVGRVAVRVGGGRAAAVG